MAEFADVELLEDGTFRKTLDRAVRLLGQREHGRIELERKLVRKGFREDVAHAVVDKLQSDGLQSDERYAATLVRRRIERGYGPIYIRQELRQRRVDDELAEAELTHTGEFWLGEACRVLQKKFSNRPDARDAKGRFLARRGFPADLIYRALGKL